MAETYAAGEATAIILNMVPFLIIVLALSWGYGKKERPPKEYIQFQGRSREILVIQRRTDRE